MNTQARHTAILNHARTSGKAPATALAQTLGVAVQTIRRDLRALCDAGLLERVHGAAARLIPDHATLFLNIGTTTEAVARALSNHKNLMVVTNNLNVANILANHQSCDVVVAGGNLRRADGGLVGDLAALAIARFKVDYAIIGASAIDPDGDLLDFDPEEVRVSRQIIDAARACMVVADASKLSRKAPVRIASLSEVTHFVTDRVPSERMAHMLSDWDTKLHVSRRAL